MKLTNRTITRKMPVLEDGADTYHLPLQRQEPTTWKELHKANYGINPENNTPLKQQTFPQAIRLITKALQRKQDERFLPVIEGLHRYVITGDSLALWTPQGLYGIDHPSKDLIAQLNKDNQQELLKIQEGLDKRLSGASGSTVSTSEDGYVRFADHDNIIYDSQDRKTFGGNPGLIVVAGNKTSARALANSSKAYDSDPAFFGIGKTNNLTVRVPGVYSNDFDGRLGVYSDGFPDCDGRVSFGVAN